MILQKNLCNDKEKGEIKCTHCILCVHLVTPRTVYVARSDRVNKNMLYHESGVTANTFWRWFALHLTVSAPIAGQTDERHSCFIYTDVGPEP